MRRRHLATAVFCILAVLLAGCGYKDGTYSAEFTNFDSLGYKDRLQITVTDGVITDAQFDGVNEEGGLKSEDEAYAGRMRPLCGTDPAGIRQYYSEALTGLKDPKDLEVDAVSGATVSAQHFAALWQALQTPMKKGETDPVTVADIPEFSPAASTDE
ncbi:MAG TPA: FMN-binding protein [Candidatus Fournierella merdavium]|nr:FMN-binding protein [Candidatus Fournierella merdavium]